MVSLIWSGIAICKGKGVIRDKALNRTAKKQEQINPADIPLWNAIMRFVNEPKTITKDAFVAVLKKELSAGK